MIAVDHSGPNESIDVIKLLLDMNPNSISEKGSGGRYPLHIAVEVPKPNLSIIRYLASLYPEAISSEISIGKFFSFFYNKQANK